MELPDAKLADVGDSDKSNGETAEEFTSVRCRSSPGKIRGSKVGQSFLRYYRSLGAVRDYSTVFSGHALSALIGLVTSVFLARSLDKADFGAYSVFLAMSIIFASVIDMGMTQSLVRFGSQLRRDNDRVGLSDIVIAAVKGKAIVGSIIGIIGFVLVYNLNLGEDSIEVQILMLVPICGFAISFFYLTQGILQIQRNFRGVSILLVVKGAMFLSAVFVAGFIVGITLLLVCFMFLAMTVAAIVPFLGSFARLVKDKSRSTSRGNIRLLFSFGKWIAISGLASSLVAQMPVAAVFGYYGPQSAADFSVAVVMVGVLGILSVPLMTVLMPDLSRIETKSALKEYLASTYRFLIPLVLLILVGLFVASEPLIIYLYGVEYSGGVVLLRILLIPFILAFTLLPVNMSMTYVFNRPIIPSLTNVVQLIALVAAISMMSYFNDVVILVAVYGLIKVSGSVGVFLISIFFIRTRDERLSPVAR